MGNRDFRVEAKRLTPQEKLERYRTLVGSHLVSFAGLWPTPKDYAGLRSSWGKDLLAGVTVGIVALPLALGFGVASGAGAAAGLVTAIIAGLVAAIFGGSHLQVSGPTGAMTVVLLPVIAKHGVETVPLLAIFAGIIVVAMALTAVGRSVEFIPLSVVEGFTIGIGVIIALQQLPLVLGTERAEAESTLVSSWQTLASTDWMLAWQPLLVTVGVIAVHLLGHRFFRRLPLSLIAIVVATVAVELTGAEVNRIGALPTGLPMPAMPSFNAALLQDLIAPAFAVAALAALESLLSARVADGMRPDLTQTSPDRELMGQGLANVASGFFGGLPATGAIARTAVSVRSGAKTRLASVSHAVVLLLVMLLLAPLVALIPMAALGGVLLVTAGRMINLGLVRTLTTVTRADRNTFWLTLGATIFLDLVAAVLLGIGMAALMSLRHMASYSVVARQRLPTNTREGDVDLSPEHEHLRPKVAVFRVDGALFYGNARRFVDEVTAVEDEVSAVILRCHRMTILDASGADAIKAVGRQFKARGVSFVVQGMTESQQRSCRLMNVFDDDQHVRELSEAVEWAVRSLADTER
ncbi:MAG TPA: SulP family inorganic anion transporter [Arachnia sp.]|nr:SulP family inorganic anion transporter [Arachnia sp.]